MTDLVTTNGLNQFTSLLFFIILTNNNAKTLKLLRYTLKEKVIA